MQDYYDAKKEPKKKIGVDNLHLNALSQAPSDRNPARHLTVKVPLQSESSLKCDLHCLGPRISIAGYPCEWATTARFALGAARGFLIGNGIDALRKSSAF